MSSSSSFHFISSFHNDPSGALRSTAKIERGLGTEHARLGTFRAGPNCLHNRVSNVCLFVCLSVCLFFRTTKNRALLGINLCISLNNIRSTSKNYQSPPPSGLCTQSQLKGLFVCLLVCLFIFPHKLKLCTIGDKFSDISNKHPLHEQKILAPPPSPGLSRQSILKFVCVFLFVCMFFFFAQMKILHYWV